MTLSDFNDVDMQAEGSGSQESQVSAGGLDRRITEGAAYFAAMEVEPDHRSPPRIVTRTATRKSTSSSDSQFGSQSSESQSSQERSHWQDKEPRDAVMQPPSPLKRHHQESASASASAAVSSSRATSSASGMSRAHADDADADDEPNPKRKKGRPTCPVCMQGFADEPSLSRHRGAFKTRPKCLDLDAAPLTVYLCCMEPEGCRYKDHRLDNLVDHEAKHHSQAPVPSNRENARTISFSRADLEKIKRKARSRR